jgi:hypothetical protein
MYRIKCSLACQPAGEKSRCTKVSERENPVSNERSANDDETQRVPVIGHGARSRFEIGCAVTSARSGGIGSAAAGRVRRLDRSGFTLTAVCPPYAPILILAWMRHYCIGCRLRNTHAKRQEIMRFGPGKSRACKAWLASEFDPEIYDRPVRVSRV